jgi:tetratricopeptide (TPR) repeat protein
MRVKESPDRLRVEGNALAGTEKCSAPDRFHYHALRMIETALVYLHALRPKKHLIGCGTLVEGGYVATCRHVWRRAASDHPPEVEIEYVHARRAGAPLRSRATLADACEGTDDPSPDLVLLTPDIIPDAVMPLQLAAHGRFEAGDGHAIAGLVGLDPADPTAARDVQVRGTIADYCGADGRRQFTGSNAQAYWTDRGSSGSPVFRDGGQQLAGILSLSERGVRPGGSALHEAFVVPATTIRRYVTALVSRHVAADKGIGPSDLQHILARIGAGNVPVADMPARLRRFVDAALARADAPLAAPSDEAGDIAAVIRAARDRLRQFDAAGARDLLQAKIDDEMHARTARLLPLLKERAEVERLGFEHERAKATLAEIVSLAPDDFWAWIDLGDLWRMTGKLDRAAAAYRRGGSAAKRAGDERDAAVSHGRIGDVLQAQGDLPAALRAYRAGLRIAETLARRDPNHAAGQRDLTVSLERIGDVLQAQRDLPAALDAYRSGLDIRVSLARRDPADALWQRDLSISHDRIGDVLDLQGDLPAALLAYEASLALRTALAARDPADADRQRDLSVSQNKIGDVKQAQGDLPAALSAYRAGIAIADTLARRDPANTLWQRDLSVSHDRIGDVLKAQGRLPAALDAYRAGLVIREALVRRDPGNTEWQRDLAVCQVKLSACVPEAARALLERALDIVRALQEADRLAPADAWMPADLAFRLAALPDPGGA